jgi:hypothetical protein
VTSDQKKIRKKKVIRKRAMNGIEQSKCIIREREKKIMCYNEIYIPSDGGGE